MLLSESCHLSGLKQSGMIHLTLKFAIKMELHTQLTRKKSAFCITLRGSKTGCQTQRNVQCCRPDGKLNSNLPTKKTHFLHCLACKQWSSKAEFWGLARFVQSLDDMQSLGVNFHGKSRTGSAGRGGAGPGSARPGEARRGGAWHGKANTLLSLRRGQQFGEARPGKARQGEAGHGWAGRGGARHGKAWQTHCLFYGGGSSLAKRGIAWRGAARPGAAWRGEARQTHCSFYKENSSLAGLGSVRRGEAGRGTAWHGTARHGKHTASFTEGEAVC